MIRLLSALLAVWLLHGAASAQDAHVIHTDDNGNAAVRVDAYVSGGSLRGVGLGFVRFEVENIDDRPHVVDVALRSRRFADSDVATHRSLTVTAAAIERFVLPVTVPPDAGELEVRIDGSSTLVGVNFHRGRGHVGLFVSDESGSASLGLTALGALPSDTPGDTPGQYAIDSSALPTDWRQLTAFSAVVVDGRATVGGAAQEALRRYAFVGGRVVVAAARMLPAGPLRDIAERGVGVHAVGMGHVAAVRRFDGDTTGMREVLAQLPALGRGGWPVDRQMFVEQEIAGLGRAPVTAFLLVILLFAVLVGPVNFLVLRKRRQPLLALVTVPLLGFGTTLVILAYGIFHDGFGVRDVVRSWTVLDQVDHEAATISARTLFAGLGPSDLSMAAGSLLLSGRAGFHNDDWPDRWRWDADRQVLDGGVLPSRTITPLVSVQQGPVRARLTVRRSGEVLEVLPDGGIQPAGPIVLRDLAGDFWAGERGRLRRVPATQGRAMFAEMRGSSALATTHDGVMAVPVRLPEVLPSWGLPGTYATTVAQAPWLDEHGMTIDYDDQQHWVFGRMHDQDFVQ
ncbi:MAG: hypothetical protein KAI24_14205 [Planctomycetes bacterium]|nr:hypothetical protein [Planctomycetota bacterium]